MILDLIYFYIKTNYNQYLEEQDIKIIPEDKINSVIENLYDNRKEHLKKFIKESLQIMLKDEYPGDLIILNILVDIFNDDTLCKNRLLVEIRLHQQTLSDQRDYTKLI